MSGDRVERGEDELGDGFWLKHMTRCEPPSISVIVAPTRWAIDLTTSAAAVLAFAERLGTRATRPGCHGVIRQG
jgi:hypothetical protein